MQTNQNSQDFLQNIYISNKCLFFLLSTYQRKIQNIKQEKFQPWWYNKCILSSKSEYYYDFWRSCDTEDWSNHDEN